MLFTTWPSHSLLNSATAWTCNWYILQYLHWFLHAHWGSLLYTTTVDMPTWLSNIYPKSNIDIKYYNAEICFSILVLVTNVYIPSLKLFHAKSSCILWLPRQKKVHTFQLEKVDPSQCFLPEKMTRWPDEFNLRYFRIIFLIACSRILFCVM